MLFRTMKGKKGFTLIELLIVIAIVGILTGVVTIGFRGGQDALKLARAANQMARDIRSTMERAINSQVHNAGTGNENECTPPPPDKPISPGYGIYFDASTPSSRKNVSTFSSEACHALLLLQSTKTK